MRNLRERIGDIFVKWEEAARDGRERNQPLNDNVIAKIRDDVLLAIDGPICKELVKKEEAVTPLADTELDDRSFVLRPAPRRPIGEITATLSDQSRNVRRPPK